MMIGGKQIGGERPGERNKDGSGTTKSGDFFFIVSGFGTHVVATTVSVTGWCTHTPCRTHNFLTHFPCVAYRHRAHAWLKVFAVRMSYLSISPSPFSCFIRRLCCSRTVTSRPHSCLHSLCRTVPDPKARVKRTSARAAGKFGYLADPTHSTDPR